MPLGGTLDPNDSWMILPSLMSGKGVEEAYAPQVSPTTGASAKPVRLALRALFIKQRLGLTVEKTVGQIREDEDMSFFLGFAAYTSKVPNRLVDDDSYPLCTALREE